MNWIANWISQRYVTNIRDRSKYERYDGWNIGPGTKIKTQEGYMHVSLIDIDNGDLLCCNERIKREDVLDFDNGDRKTSPFMAKLFRLLKKIGND